MMDNAWHWAENDTVAVEGEITEDNGYLFIDSQQDANQILYGDTTLVRRHVRLSG